MVDGHILNAQIDLSNLGRGRPSYPKIGQVVSDKKNFQSVLCSEKNWPLPIAAMFLMDQYNLKQEAQWATIAHLLASIMFGDTKFYNAHLNTKYYAKNKSKNEGARVATTFLPL